jgi:hypothetical protein
MSMAFGMSVIPLDFSIHHPAKLTFFKQAIGKSVPAKNELNQEISEIKKSIQKLT